MHVKNLFVLLRDFYRHVSINVAINTSIFSTDETIPINFSFARYTKKSVWADWMEWVSEFHAIDIGST